MQLPLCPGFGLAGMGAFKFAAFIRAYRTPNPVAGVASALKVFFLTSFDMLRAVTGHPWSLPFFAFSPRPHRHLPTPCPTGCKQRLLEQPKQQHVWRSFRPRLILVSSTLSALLIAARCLRHPSGCGNGPHRLVVDVEREAGRSNYDVERQRSWR